MRKSDIISILLTLLVGLFSGAYLYLTGFAPIESEVVVPDAEEISQFVIIGDVYGGCRDACPSFQLVGDGSYRFLYAPSIGAEKVLRQGKIPYELNKRLRSVLTESELSKQSQTIQPATCNSYVDGIDVVYEITLNSKTYTVNSCGTAADGESELWVTLSQLWSFFETI